MKQRLRVLESSSASAPKREPLRTFDPDVERVALGRPLVCIATDSEPSLRFACALLETLRDEDCAALPLVLAPAAAVPRVRDGALDQLLVAAGVEPWACDRDDPAASAVTAARALPDDSVVVGLGPELAIALRPLLTVAVGPASPLPEDWVDLRVSVELEGVAVRIARHLAARLQLGRAPAE